MPNSKIPPNLNSTASLPCEHLQLLQDLRLKLQSLDDPRVCGKVIYPLPDLLLIAICAMLSGCDHFTEMELFAKTQIDWLRTFLSLPKRAPSHDVFRNAFIALKPQAMLDVLAHWAGTPNGKHLIIDGKCLRGTNQGQQGAAARVYLLRAWVKESGLSIAQRPCGEKSCELAALPELLQSVQLDGAIVTIDAMGTHPEIAQQIHEGGGDYVLCLKKNNLNAFREVQSHFDAIGQISPELPTAPLPPLPAGYDRHQSVEHVHGRFTMRMVTATEQIPWFTRDWKWHGLKSIIEVRRISHRNGKRTELSEQVHYYLSSLPAQSAALGKRIRDHWLVENQCHWVLDMTFGEDHCQVQDANAAQNLSLLRELTAKVLKVAAVKRSMASVRKEACLSPAFRLKVLLDGIIAIFRA